MDTYNTNPEAKKLFRMLCRSKRNQILSHILDSSDEYKDLCRCRANASMALKKALATSEAHELFEEYLDTVYQQEIYELDAVYAQAFTDACNKLKRNHNGTLAKIR